jgi:Cu/Ag efflux pump CusA
VAVIDCAVLGVDGIASQLRRRRDEGSDNSSATIILEAAHELRGALIYATIIVLLGLVPLFFIQGVNGALLRPLAISYAAAVLGASAVAMIITPALALLLWPRLPHDRRESPLVRRLGHGYGRALSWSLRSPRPAYVAVIVLAVAGIALVPFYRHTMLPVLHDSDLQVHLEAAPGTSLPEMNRITALVGRELRTVPGVREVGGHVGRAVLSDQVVGANSGELWVRLDPSADYERTLAAISAVAEGYQGLDGQVLTYPTESVHQALAGNDAAFTVRVYGQDVDVLRGKAEEVRQLLSKVGGVNDVNVEAQPEEPTVEIEVDLAKAQSYGIKPGDVRRAAATLLSGLLVGNLFEERKVFDVVVWGTPNTRSNLTTIQNLMIDTPSRGQVRLADVANVQLRPNPTVIRHEAVSRKIDVTAEVQGRSLNAAADEVQHRLKEVSFPLEYHAELLGDYGDPLAARTRLFGLVAVAAIGIFLLLQAALASWRLASLSFVTILASLTGGAVAAFADGRTLTAGSLLGFLAVFGLAARAVIILIRRYQRLEDDGHEEFSPELVRQGSGAQLAPVVITALAAGLAFVPVAVLGDVPGLEIVHAAAPVVLGGLVTWAAVTLFVVPALYLRFGHSWRRRDATP